MDYRVSLHCMTLYCFSVLTLEANRVVGEVGLCLVVLWRCRVQSPQSYHNTQFRKEAVFISPIETWSRSYFWRVKRPLFIQRNWNFVCVQLVQRACKRCPFFPQPVSKWGMPIRTRNLIRSPTSRYTTAWPTDDQIMRLVVGFGMRSPISFATMCEASFWGIFVTKRAHMGLVILKFAVRVMMVRPCC